MLALDVVEIKDMFVVVVVVVFVGVQIKKKRAASDDGRKMKEGCSER